MASPEKSLFYFSYHNTKGKGAKGAGKGMGFGQTLGAPVALPRTVGHGDPNNITFSEIQIVDILNHYNWTNSKVRSRAGTHTSDINAKGREVEGSDKHVGFGFSQGRNAAKGLHNWAGIPVVMLSEYRPLFNSSLANIKYQMSAAVDAGKQGGQMAQGAVTGTLDAVADIMPSFMSGATKGVSDAIKNTAFLEKFGTAVGKAAKLGGDITEKVNPAGKNSSGMDLTGSTHLAGYQGLYPASPSGFKYIFPFLNSQQYRSISQAWGPGGINALTDFTKSMSQIWGITGAFSKDLAGAGKGILGAPGQAYGGALGVSKAVGGISEPTGFIEQNYTYTGYGTQGTSITIRFLLSNTNDFEEVIQNWHLVYLLCYQNLPNKISKVSVEPPCLYEVEVLNHYYSPFSYISSLNVTGLGTTRTMAIPLRVTKDQKQASGSAGEGTDAAADDQKDSTNPKAKTMPVDYGRKMATNTTGVIEYTSQDFPAYINALIPEAYQVEMTLQPLLTDAKNLLLQSLKQSQTLFTASVQMADDRTVVHKGFAASRVLENDPVRKAPKSQ